MLALMTVILPITLYNAIETMNNVEAMSAAGDSYSVRECQAVDGLGTSLGALFGGVFPTTVYIATVGSKWMGAGRGYSLLNGAVYGLATMFGLIAFIAALIPVAVVAPILVFVGMSMIATAFNSNHARHYPAVALAMLPYFANYLMTRFNRGAPEVVEGISSAIGALGQGAMFSAILLGAMCVAVIDRQFRQALLVGGLVATGIRFGVGLEGRERDTFGLVGGHLPFAPGTGLARQDGCAGEGESGVVRRGHGCRALEGPWREPCRCSC